MTRRYIDRVASIAVEDATRGRRYVIPATVKPDDTEATVRAHMAEFHPDLVVLSVSFGLWDGMRQLASEVNFIKT